MSIKEVDRADADNGEISGSVTVDNVDPIPVELSGPQVIEFPEIQDVNIVNVTPIDVNVDFPLDQTVSFDSAQEVLITNPDPIEVITSFPSNQDVTITNASPIQVDVDFPATQQVAFGSAQSVNSTKVLSAANANSRYRSAALESENAVRVTAGLLMGCYGIFDANADTGIYYLHFYNTAAVPLDGSTAILECVKINHVSGFDDEISFQEELGIVASTGISFALSSTQFLKTKVVGQDYLALTIAHRS